MADINKVNTKPNEIVEKLSFLRCSSKKRLSFEQSLAIRDISTFSTSCIGGKLYQIIQSNPNSLFSFDSFNIHQTKNDILRENSKRTPGLNESQFDLNLANLNFNHLVENEEEKVSELAMEGTNEVSNSSSSKEDENSNSSYNSCDNSNINSYSSNDNDNLMITTLIQEDKRCDVCSCYLF